MVTLDKAVEIAARHLPERFTLSLVIEKDSGTLELFDVAEGLPIDLELAGFDLSRPLSEQIVDAVAYANKW